MSTKTLLVLLVFLFIHQYCADQQSSDKIFNNLPGQNFPINFFHYSGYVTVEEGPGRNLFYWLIESPDQPTSKPLVLWLNGGPGCSSIGYGEAGALGPFRIQPDGTSLYLNVHAWNQAANILFLDSPAGVGYSYSRSVDDMLNVGDNRTAENSLTFLLLWLERFSQYKGRDFYLTGESYAGIYITQLAQAILRHNSANNNTTISLKGYMVGNPAIDFMHDSIGSYRYMWSLGLISDQTYHQLNETCLAIPNNYIRISRECRDIVINSIQEMGRIDMYNIFTGACTNIVATNVSDHQSDGSDPCTSQYAAKYFNLPDVQKALHVNPQYEHPWKGCRDFIFQNWKDNASSVLDIYQTSIQAGLRIWVISGNMDSVVPVTATRASVGAMNLNTVSPWRSWTLDGQVGGWVQEYTGLTFVVVNGAGHEIPKDKPKEALAIFKAFLSDKAP